MIKKRTHQFLEILDLSYNKLTHLPETIGDLSNLKRLYLQWNLLSSLPESLSKLENFQRLEIEYNLIKEIPECIDENWPGEHRQREYEGEEVELFTISFPF